MMLALVTRPRAVPEYATLARHLWNHFAFLFDLRLESCRRHAHSVVDHISQTLRWFGNRLLPRPPLLVGQRVRFSG